MTKHFQETVSLSIVLSMFIHKISSKHGLDTTPSKLNFYTRHFCEDVGELYTIFTFRFSFWTLFDTQLMNFVRQFQTFNVRILKAYLQYTGPAEQFSKCGGQSTPFEVKFRDGGGGGGTLWNLKIIYLVPTNYFLIQLQLINHFFEYFNKGERSQEQKGVTIRSSIIIFGCFKSLSVLSLWLFRTFLYSLSLNGVMFQMFLAFDLLKFIFPAAMVADLPAEACTEIGTISFIMLQNILILRCENMERLSRNFQLFSIFRNFQAIFAPSNSYVTEYSCWVPLSFVKIVVLNVTI